MKKLRNILLTIITALAGALGGQGIKFLRRFFIPLTFASIAYWKYQNLWVLLLLSLIYWYSSGYGEDSWVRKLFKGNNYLTRGFISAGKCLSILILPLISSNWLFYILGSIAIILTGALISWRDFGEVKFFKYKLLVVDLIVYGVDGLVMSLLI